MTRHLWYSGNRRSELAGCVRGVERLQVENEILREAAEPLIHPAAARDRAAFILARRGRLGVAGFGD
jgi:hypothetical protein